MNKQNEASNEVELQLLRVATRLFYFIVMFGTGLIFAGGVFYSQFGSLREDVSELKAELVSDLQNRTRILEQRIDRGMLPLTEKELDKFESRLIAIERLLNSLRDHHREK